MLLYCLASYIYIFFFMKVVYYTPSRVQTNVTLLWRVSKLVRRLCNVIYYSMWGNTDTNRVGVTRYIVRYCVNLRHEQNDLLRPSKRATEFPRTREHSQSSLELVRPVENQFWRVLPLPLLQTPSVHHVTSAHSDQSRLHTTQQKHTTHSTLQLN